MSGEKMNSKMIRRLSLLTVFCCAAFVARNASAQKVTLESLLDGAKLDYSEKDGLYKVTISGDARDVLIVCGTTTMWKDDDGNPVDVVWLWTSVLSVPKGFHHPARMLHRIATINDTLKPGNVSVNGDNGNVYYNSTFWLSSATPQILYDELLMAFYRKPELRKELQPYLEEE